MSDDAKEKGFNEDELKDIMDEIESLEKEFSSQEESNGSSDVHDELEKEVDNILDGVEEPKPAKEPQSTAAKVSQLPKKKVKLGSQHSKMHFSVEGEMTLELSFSVGGKDLKLRVDENEGFVVELDEGAKFCLPIHSKAA